jgi:hypothetical protein
MFSTDIHAIQSSKRLTMIGAVMLQNLCGVYTGLTGGLAPSMSIPLTSVCTLSTSDPDVCEKSLRPIFSSPCEIGLKVCADLSTAGVRYLYLKPSYRLARLPVMTQLFRHMLFLLHSHYPSSCGSKSLSTFLQTDDPMYRYLLCPGG